MPDSPGPIKTFPTENNNKFLKIGLIVGGVLLIIVLGEVAYYVASNTGLTPSAPEKVASPSPLPDSLNRVFNPRDLPQLNTPSANQQSSIINVDKVQKYSQFANVLNQNQVNVKTAEINTVFEGVVFAAEKQDLALDGVTYNYLLSLRGPSGKSINYRLTSDEVAGATVFRVVNGKQVYLSLTDIKIGDTVSITQSVNLLDTSPNDRIVFEIK